MTEVPLGFTFNYFNFSYEKINISSHGYINFGGSSTSSPPSYSPGQPISTGESIWLWWMPYIANTGVFKYITLGKSPSKVFIVEYLVPGLSVQLSPDGPDLCSDLLSGQIRLYESDNSIEIEILKAPVAVDSMALSGIYSDIWNRVHLSLFPHTFTFGNGTWNNTYFQSTHDPAWLRTLCPFPINVKFLCSGCSIDSDCIFPDLDPKIILCKNPSPDLHCNTDGYCENQDIYISEIDHYGTIAALPPRTINYPTNNPICPYTAGCCPYGPQTYFPSDLTEECIFTQSCFDTINGVLCDYCSPLAPVGRVANKTYLYISQDQKDSVESACADFTCSDSIFNWPDFPLKKNPECPSFSPTDRSGTITDGSYPGFYANSRYCSWEIEIPFCTTVTIQILFMDIELNYDFISIKYLFGDEILLTGKLIDVEQKYPDLLITDLPCSFTVEFITDKDIVYTGFKLYYSTPDLPVNYPMIIQSQNSSLALSYSHSTEKLSLSPFTGDKGQFWALESDSSDYYIINYFDTSLALEIDLDTLEVNNTFSTIWSITGTTDNWLIFSNTYALNKTDNGIPTLDTDLSPIPSHLWALNDAINLTSVNCPKHERIQITRGSAGVITDLSGDLLYASDFGCKYTLIPSSSGLVIELRLTQLDINTDFLTIDGDEYFDILTGSLEDNLNSLIVKGINVTGSTDILFDVMDGRQQGFSLSYTVYCDFRCEIAEYQSKLESIRQPFCESISDYDSSSCGTYNVLTEYNGLIVDGSGDDRNYNDSARCEWFLNPPQIEGFVFIFCEFTTEDDYDFLTIQDFETDYSISYSGSYNDFNPVLLIYANTVDILFQSDDSFGGEGFSVLYTTLAPGCQCSQLCLATPNENICLCRKGFYLDPDGITCIDVNECELGYCANATGCTNIPGSFQCTCKPGYQLSSDYCIEVDECAQGISNCTDLCINTIGSYICRCKPNRYLLEDGQSCSDIPNDWTKSDSVFTFSFCRPNNKNLTRSQNVFFQGCNAVTYSGVTKKCILPYIYQNTTYQTCIPYESNNKDDKYKELMCATQIDSNSGTLETGLCGCTAKRTNVILHSPAFAEISDSAGKLNDGDIRDDISVALYLQSDSWKTSITDWQKIKEIKLFGCPSCYKTKFAFSLDITFLSDLFELKVIWEKHFVLSSEFHNLSLLIPPETGEVRVIQVSSPLNIYLAELQVFADIFDVSNPSPLDCGLLMSRNVITSSENPTGSDYIWNEIEFNIKSGFKSIFQFSILKDTTDILVYTIANKMHSPSIRVVFDMSKLEIRLEKDVLNTPPLIQSINDTNTVFLKTGIIHICSVIVQINSLVVYLDNITTPLFTYSDDLLNFFGSPLKSGFLLESSSRKRQTNGGGFVLHSWNGLNKFIPVVPPTTSLVDTLPVIIGVAVAILVFFLIVMAILFLLFRPRNSAVENLPPEIRRHYKQFTLHSSRWDLIGEEGSAHAYLKKLGPGTKSFNRLAALWLEMGGQDIEYTEACAVHNILLLNGFATKHTSLTSQVNNDPKNFMKDNWRDRRDPKGIRSWTRDVYDKWVERFPWNTNLKVKIVPAVHGTNEDLALNITKTGFVALAKLDSGYYGKGIYFTTSVHYALPYFATKAEPTVLICLVISGNAYPVIEHPLFSNKSLIGAALTPGYHSHYVLTRKNGYPCHKIMSGQDDEEFYDELIIEQEAAILPFYFLKIYKKNLSLLAMNFQKAQEKLKEEEADRLESEGIKMPIQERLRVSSGSSSEGPMRTMTRKNNLEELSESEELGRIKIFKSKKERKSSSDDDSGDYVAQE